MLLDRQAEVQTVKEAWARGESSPVNPDDMDTWTDGGRRKSVDTLRQLYQERLAEQEAKATEGLSLAEPTHS
jgi:hypothetical protein